MRSTFSTSAFSASVVLVALSGLVGCGGDDGAAADPSEEAAGAAGSGGNASGKGGSAGVKAGGAGGVSAAGAAGGAGKMPAGGASGASTAGAAGAGATGAGAGGSGAMAGVGGQSAGAGGQAEAGKGGSPLGGAGGNAAGSAGAAAGGKAGAAGSGSAGNGGTAQGGNGGTAGTGSAGAAGAGNGGSGGKETDDAGFTTFVPGSGNRVVYVADDGVDTRDGSTPAKSVKTLAKALSLVAKEKAPHVLLKRGDTFTAQNVGLSIAGLSAKNPFVLGAYGDLKSERPIIVTGDQDGLELKASATFVAIQSIHLKTQGYTGKTKPYGIAGVGIGKGLLIEDCKVERFGVGISIQQTSEVTMRRNVVIDSVADKDGKAGPNGHSQGIYSAEVETLVLEDNVLDHNGWSDGFTGGEPTIFNHDAYIQADCSKVTFTGNIVARASAHGAQIRPGGTVEENLFLRDPIGLSFGHVNGDHAATENGVSGTASNNVFLYAGDISDQPGEGRGTGMYLGNINATGAVVENNLFAKNEGKSEIAFILESHIKSGVCTVNPVDKLVIRHNTVFDWSRLLSVSACLPASLSTIVVEDNVIADHQDKYLVQLQTGTKGMKLLGNDWFTNRADKKWFDVQGDKLTLKEWETITKESGNGSADSTFVDKGRDAKSYIASLGLGSSEQDFYTAVRKQRRGAWDPRLTAAKVNAYIRAGYKLASGTRGVQ